MLGAIVAKFVFAVFLTVVLTASRVFSSLEFGWFGTWLLLAAFWWGTFVKRHEIIGFVAAGTPQQHGNGLGHALSHGYYAWMLGRGARHAASRATRPAIAGVESIRQRRQDHQQARTAATASLARERLEERHRGELVAGQQEARGVVAKRDGLQRELRATDRRLAGFDEATAVANATRSKPPVPNSEQRQLLEHRRELRALLADPAARWAEQAVRQADRNVALTGDSITGKDLEIHRARRTAELRSTDADADGGRATRGPLRRGRDEPSDNPAQRAVREERDLLSADHGTNGERSSDVARRWLDTEELRRRKAEELAGIRADRRRRRAGAGAYRRR